MAKVSETYTGNYYKATDLSQPVTLAMAQVANEKMPDGKDKPVLRFSGEKRGLVLNKTNAELVAEIYGDEMDSWAGRLIELHATITDYAGKTVPCVRCRAPHIGQAPQAQVQPAAQQVVPQPQVPTAAYQPAAQPHQQPVPQQPQVQAPDVPFDV